MLRYISIIFIVLSFTGCQQALDDLNKSLEESRMNLNSNQNEYIQKKNERIPVPRLNEEEVNARYEEMFKRWAEEDKQKSIKYEQEEKERKIKQAEQKSKIDSERKKVQNACQTWLKKSQKEVYSLGVGENIVTMYGDKAGIIYQIKSIEKNTFLVWDGFMKKNAYVPKSSFIPFSSLDNAPSKYCYE